jgi:hypothetical protein
MDGAAKHKLQRISTQTQKRADELIATVVGNMKRTPAASSLSAAQMEFPFALDSAFDENTTALEELRRIAMSDFGFVYLNGDTSTGGVLTFHDRRFRANPGTVNPIHEQTDNTMVEMSAPRTRGNILNRVRTTIHPRRADTTACATVLYSLDGFPAIPAGQSITVIGQYRDPNQEAVRIAGGSINVPVAGTDYTFGSAAESGLDNLGSDLSLSASTGANGAAFALTNIGSQTGFVTKLQVRGQGIFDYAPLTLESTSASSQNTYGLYTHDVDMPYEFSVDTAKTIGDDIVSKQKDPKKFSDTISFIANRSSDMMLTMLQREPGGLITIAETVTGLIGGHFFVQGVNLDISGDDLILCTWSVVPSLDPNLNDYWSLDDISDELGTGTRLAL